MDAAEAQRLLWPPAEALAEAWGIAVRSEREQTERLPDRPRPEDFYAPVAESFRGTTAPLADPITSHLVDLVEPGEVWTDIGAGGGRYTLPIATKAGKVYAVEPSEGMRNVLTSAMTQNSVTNIEVLDERWPGPTAAPVADVSFISHVGYDIEAIGGFLDQMEAQARRLCVAVLFHIAPTAYFAPLWEAVHDEPRYILPALGPLMALLFARGRAPTVALHDIGPRLFANEDALHTAAQRAVWVRPGSSQDDALAAAIRERAVAIEGGVTISAASRLVAVVTWRPD
jgi:hypothetical protein